MAEQFGLELSAAEWWDIYNALIHHENYDLAEKLSKFMGRSGI